MAPTAHSHSPGPAAARDDDPVAVDRPRLPLLGNCGCGPGCSCGCQAGGPCQCGGSCG